MDNTALSRSLDGSLGYLELCFHEIQWKSANEQQFQQDKTIQSCEIRVANFSKLFHSFETQLLVGESVNENLELKSWLGCTLKIVVQLKSRKTKLHKPLILHSDPFVVQHSKEYKTMIPLFSDSFLIGDAYLVLTYNFHPNQFSFPYLALSCYGHYRRSTAASPHKAKTPDFYTTPNNFIPLFLSEFRSLLSGQLQSRAGETLMTSEDSERLLHAIAYVETLLCDNDKLLRELLSETDSKQQQEQGCHVYFLAHVVKDLLSALQSQYCPQVTNLSQLLLSMITANVYRMVVG